MIHSSSIREWYGGYCVMRRVDLYVSLIFGQV